MHPSTILLSAFAASALGQSMDCSNVDDASDYNITNPVPAPATPSGDFSVKTLTSVDLYVHILVSQKLPSPPTQTVNGKIATLNKNFASWGYKFNLKDTSVTVNATWAAGIDNDKAAKQAALHKGDYQTLNVYMVEGATSGLCSLPINTDKTIDQAALDGDGCFVPWGPTTNSSTLTHETGHWFGLLHPFQGGCAGTDFCNDTAPQSGPSYAKMAIPGDLNSCPATVQCGGPGRQNVLNFMDYSDCASEFTPCQGARINSMFTTRRKGRKLGAGVTTK